MIVQENKLQIELQVRRPWQEHLILPLLIAGGLLTLTWIAVLMAVALQIISAIVGLGSSR